MPWYERIWICWFVQTSSRWSSNWSSGGVYPSSQIKGTVKTWFLNAVTISPAHHILFKTCWVKITATLLVLERIVSKIKSSSCHAKTDLGMFKLSAPKDGFEKVILKWWQAGGSVEVWHVFLLAFKLVWGGVGVGWGGMELGWDVNTQWVMLNIASALCLHTYTRCCSTSSHNQQLLSFKNVSQRVIGYRLSVLPSKWQLTGNTKKRWTRQNIWSSMYASTPRLKRTKIYLLKSMCFGVWRFQFQAS